MVKTVGLHGSLFDDFDGCWQKDVEDVNMGRHVQMRQSAVIAYARYDADRVVRAAWKGRTRVRRAFMTWVDCVLLGEEETTRTWWLAWTGSSDRL